MRACGGRDLNPGPPGCMGCPFMSLARGVAPGRSNQAELPPQFQLSPTFKNIIRETRGGPGGGPFKAAK